jgi:hypothetical protein
VRILCSGFPASNQPHVQRSAIPYIEGPLTFDPSVTVLLQFHVETVNNVGKDQAHLDVCEAAQRLEQLDIYELNW